MRVRGILTGTVVEDRVHVDVALFFYIGNRRVRPEHASGVTEYVALELAPTVDGHVRWQFVTWGGGVTDDEYADFLVFEG